MKRNRERPPKMIDGWIPSLQDGLHMVGGSEFLLRHRLGEGVHSRRIKGHVTDSGVTRYYIVTFFSFFSDSKGGRRHNLKSLRGISDKSSAVQ